MFEGCETGCDAAVKTSVDFFIFFQIKMFEGCETGCDAAVKTSVDFFIFSK